MKKCKICEQVKPTNEFYTVNGKVKNQCKDCNMEIQRNWYGENKELIQLRRNSRYLAKRINVMIEKAAKLGYRTEFDIKNGFEIKLEKVW